MSKRVPNILKRREKNKGTATTNASNASTLSKINENINVLVFEVIPDNVYNDKEDLSKESRYKDSLDDSDIEIISSSIKSKNRTSKNVDTKFKCLKSKLMNPTFKQHKPLSTSYKNHVLIDELTNEESNSSIGDVQIINQSINEHEIIKQSKAFEMLNNDTDVKDKTVDDETGISFEDLLDLADDNKFPCVNNDLSNVKNTSDDSFSHNENSCNHDDSAYEELENAKDKNDETDFSEMDDMLNDTSNDSNSISNFDENNKGLMDSLPPKNDPSIIDNAPLNVSSIGNSFLSTDDTETLNSLVRLKCNNCLDLVQCPNVEPQMECQKCCWKYQYQCKICTSGFVSLYSLYTHLIKFHSRGEAVHSLMIKPQFFKKPRQIKRLKCDPKELYYCQKCGSSFRLKTIRDKHETICSRNPKLNCPFCTIAMSFRKGLKEHMIITHAHLFEVNEADSIIDKIVKDGNKKRRELKAASLLQALQVAHCHKCDVRTPTHKLLDGEMICATCGDNLVFTCTDPQCSRTFPNAKALNSHARMLHVEKRDHYRCAHCFYATTSSRDLANHQKNCGDLVILPPRLFVCSNCGKSFKKERYLQIHQQRLDACIRRKQRELVCPKCNRTFRKSHWLENHRCEPAVTNSNSAESETVPTELVPLQEPEYPCPDCGKVFKQMRWFDAHKKKYCDKQRVLYRCANCRYQGFDKKKLKVHMRCAHIHLCTGKKLSCAKCGTKWTSIYSLNRHLENCSGDYEIEKVKMRRRKKKSWTEMYEYV